MATIMRARSVVTQLGGGSGSGLFQTYWRPGTSPGSTADATDILARVRTALQALNTYFATGVKFTALAEVDALDDATGAITGAFVGTLPAVVTGTSGGDPMPSQTAYLIHATTNLIVGPRLLKGRTFLAGPSETQNAPAATPITAAVTAINAAFAAMLTGGATASFPVIWHRPGAKFVAVGTSGPVTGYSAETNYWGSQRGRRF